MGIVYFKYNSLYLLILYPWLVLLPFTFPSGNHKVPISVSRLFLFCIYIYLHCFLDFTYKWYMVLVFDLFDKA